MRDRDDLRWEHDGMVAVFRPDPGGVAVTLGERLGLWLLPTLFVAYVAHPSIHWTVPLLVVVGPATLHLGWLVWSRTRPWTLRVTGNTLHLARAGASHALPLDGLAVEVQLRSIEGVDVPELRFRPTTGGAVAIEAGTWTAEEGDALAKLIRAHIRAHEAAPGAPALEAAASLRALVEGAAR